MRDRMNEVLAQSSVEAFEQLCEMFPSAENGTAKNNFTLTTVARIGYSGLDTGELLVVIRGDLLDGFGPVKEGEKAGKGQEEAAKEIINVILGNILPLLTDGNQPLRLGMPSTESVQYLDSVRKRRPAAKSLLRFDKGEVEILLYRFANKNLAAA